MTDTELLNRVAGIIDPTARQLLGLRRSGRLLLGLPSEPEAFSRALGLYQPQRPLAKLTVALMDLLSKIGFHRAMLTRIDLKRIGQAISPALGGIQPGTCGVLLGSAEHRIQRAIASYLNAGAWEVAKIAFGPAGEQVLENEADALQKLGAATQGVPRLLGLHRGEGVTVLRMPYLTGKSIQPGDHHAALDLLQDWVSDQSPMPVPGFPEWRQIEAALTGDYSCETTLGRISQKMLVPVTCHGDFARWNLRRRPDGSMIVLDWEWGHPAGMPGLDLVHYFLQDHRLVRRMSPCDAINATIEDLRRPECEAYLKRTGWTDDPLLPIIACLAYKQGAGHQDNAEMLEAAVIR